MYCFHAMYSFQWNCQNKFSHVLLFLVLQSSADIFHTKTIPQSQIWKEMWFPHHHFFGGTSQKTMISRWVIEMPRIFNIIRVGRSACLKTTHAEKNARCKGWCIFCSWQKNMFLATTMSLNIFWSTHVFSKTSCCLGSISKNCLSASSCEDINSFFFSFGVAVE